MTMTLSKVSCMSPCVALTCAFAIDVLLQKGEGNNGQCLRLELWNEPSHIILVRCCLARSLTHSRFVQQIVWQWQCNGNYTDTQEIWKHAQTETRWLGEWNVTPIPVLLDRCGVIGSDGMESSNINWILIYAYTEWWVRTKGMLMTNGNPASGRCMFSCQVTEWRQLFLLLSAMMLQAVVSVVASLVTYFDISF